MVCTVNVLRLVNVLAERDILCDPLCRSEGSGRIMPAAFTLLQQQHYRFHHPARGKSTYCRTKQCLFNGPSA